MKTKKFRKWILLFLMMCFLLLTACAAPASSAAAPPATSISPQNESAPAAVSSEPADSSAAVSSAAPAEPIAYMSYDEYFSEARELDAQTGIYSQPDEPFVYRKDGRYLFPFYLPIYGYAETKTGVLALYEGKVYNVREPGQLAEVAYAPDAPYQTVSLSRNAGAHCSTAVPKMKINTRFAVFFAPPVRPTCWRPKRNCPARRNTSKCIPTWNSWPFATSKAISARI